MNNGCWFCRQEPKCCCLNDDGKPKLPFILPSDEKILSIECFSGVAFAYASLGSNRYKFIDWLTNQLYNEDYEFYYSDGKTRFPILICTVYKAFNNDASFRWLSDLEVFAKRPILQKPHKTHLLRLQLIILAFMVARPDLARSIFNPDTMPPPVGAA